MKHGPFVNCRLCGFPIDSGGFCSLKCKGGDGVLIDCTCTQCRAKTTDPPEPPAMSAEGTRK